MSGGIRSLSFDQGDYILPCFSPVQDTADNEKVLKKQNYLFETNCQLVLSFSFFLLLVLLKDSHGNYDCEKEVIYRGAKFNDAPPEHRRHGPYGSMKLKTDTWQECQKICAGVKQCKGFMWYKEKTYWAKVCQFFSTWKERWIYPNPRMVSGLVECE